MWSWELAIYGILRPSRTVANLKTSLQRLESVSKWGFSLDLYHWQPLIPSQLSQLPCLCTSASSWLHRAFASQRTERTLRFLYATCFPQISQQNLAGLPKKETWQSISLSYFLCSHMKPVSKNDGCCGTTVSSLVQPFSGLPATPHDARHQTIWGVVSISPISFQLTKGQCRSLIFITQDQRQWTLN